MTRTIFVILSVICSGLFLTVYASSEYEKVKALVAEQAELRDDIAAADALEIRLTTLTNEYAALPQDIDGKISAMIPMERHPAKLLNDLEVIALRHGMKLQNPAVTGGSVTSKTENAETAPLTTVGASFWVTTTYPVFRNFLFDIERNLAIRDVRKIEFSELGFPVAGTSRGNPAYTFKVGLVTYSENK
jgi:Tfp pilus assembly protein PilO